MLGWYMALPLVMKIIVPAIIVMFGSVVAVFGNVQLSWGKTRIGLGGKKQRSCKDCSIILRARGVKASRRIEKLERINLKSKMNFAEQQLTIIQRILFIEYSHLLQKKKVAHEDEEKDISSYHTKLQMAITLLKDELRRAFKENGFHSLDDTQFDKYIKDEGEILINIYCEYMLTGYPSGMNVRYDEIIKIIDDRKRDITDYFESIFKKSKRIELETIDEIDLIEDDYERETNAFLNLNENGK
jgi:hypothetical protein